MSQFYVFQGEDCLGWDCFQKDGIVIGSGPDADLFLDGHGIAEAQALVQCNGEQVLVHDLAGNGLVCVNGQTATACLLGPLDVLGVGPYALKVRSRPIRGDGAGAGADEPEASRPKAPILAAWAPPAPAVRETQPRDEAAELAGLDLPEVEFLPETVSPASPPEPETPDLPPEATLAEIDTARMLHTLDTLIDQATRPSEVRGRPTAPSAPVPEKPGPAPAPTAELSAAPSFDDPFFDAPWPEPTAHAPAEEPPPSVSRPEVAQKSAAQPAVPHTAPEPVVAQPAPRAATEPAPPPAAELAPAPSLDDPFFDAPWPAPPAQKATEAPASSVARAAVAPQADAQTPAEPLVAQPAPRASPEPTPAPSLSWLGAAAARDEEEDEEEEEWERDREADFSLADRLTPAIPTTAGAHDAIVVQVVKVRGNQVLDCRYLGPGEAYRDGPGRRPRPLVERDRQRGAFLHLTKDAAGATVHTRDGGVLDAPALCRPEHLFHKRRQVYRCPLPPRSRSVLSVGPTRYVVQEVPVCPELDVPVPATASRRPLRTFLASSLVHAIVLCVGALFVSLPSPYEPPPPETRFVQIDTTDLQPLLRKPVVTKPTEALQPAPVKPPEPKKALPPTAKPAAVAKKPSPQKPTEAPAPPPADPQVAKATPGAADAGGGHGGNAINRNVNVRQAGILGALGIPDGVNLGASEALAAVTNIDAVRSTRAGEANLKVGGLVGKLGGSRIEVPAVGLVNTKGSTQVVVSAGVAGGGTVAALEKGSTGKKQVMAMVTADVRAPVQIQGGMSREEVKRVIDAHMDEITYCYETALIEEPTIMGKMAFEWRILESGRVGEVRIQSSSIRNETLHSCIRDRIRGWVFPQPRGAEVLVSYPFVFDVVGF